MSKVRKGSYKVKLPKRLSKTTVRRKVKAKTLPLFDAVPVSVAGYAKVHADGTLDLPSTSRDIRVWRVSKGCYNVNFNTKQKVITVLVQPLRKGRGPRIFARVQGLRFHRPRCHRLFGRDLMFKLIDLCGAESRMGDVCNLYRGHFGCHAFQDPRGGRVEWGLDHTFPCDCGNCHNSPPAVAEKGGD